MGSTQSTWGFSSEQLKMKFLIVCLFAAAYAAPEAEADAEADPALLYGGYGYPYAYGGYGHAYGGYGLTYGLPVAHTVVKAADAEEPAVAAVKTVAAPVAYASAAYPYAAYHMPPMPTMLDTHMPIMLLLMVLMLLMLLMVPMLLMLLMVPMLLQLPPTLLLRGPLMPLLMLKLMPTTMELMDVD